MKSVSGKPHKQLIDSGDYFFSLEMGSECNTHVIYVRVYVFVSMLYMLLDITYSFGMVSL